MKFTIGNNGVRNSIILYVFFAFIICAIYVIAGGIISVIKLSDNFKNIIFYISGFIPIIIIEGIIKTENDPEEE